MIATWADYKEVTGDTATAEGLVNSRLLRAQRRAEDFTGRLFDQVERTESLPIIDGKVWPKAYPVVSVSLPETAAVAPDSLSIDSGQTSVVDALSDVLGLNEARITGDRPQLLVTYVGGYAVGTAPEGLVEVICEIAQRYSLPANTVGVPAGATSVQVGKQSYSGGALGGSSKLPLSIRNELTKYRHIRLRMAD